METGHFSSRDSLCVAAFIKSRENGRFVSDAQNYVSPKIKLQLIRDGFESYEVEQLSISNILAQFIKPCRTFKRMSVIAGIAGVAWTGSDVRF